MYAAGDRPDLLENKSFSYFCLFEVALFRHRILSNPNRQEGHVGWIEWWNKEIGYN